MSRLFGYISNDPRRAPEALEPVRDLLVSPGPVESWGLGYVSGGHVLLKRFPRPSDPVDLYDTIQTEPSDYIIAHTSDETSFSGNDNTQPFRFRQWMFAQQGGVPDFSDMRTVLREQMPGYIGRAIRGKTSAEHVFHTFLSFLHHAGALDDPNCPADIVRGALRDATSTVQDHLAQAGKPSTLGNIMVSNGRLLQAVRLDGPLLLRNFREAATRSKKEFRATLLLSFADASGEGFEGIPAQTVVQVSRDLQTDLADLAS